MINEKRLEILEKRVELMSKMEDNFITQIDILSKMCELLYERVERLEGKNGRDKRERLEDDKTYEEAYSTDRCIEPGRPDDEGNS